uniref:Alanine dehydrogenase/pyridine nucleotide transhydrogenase N-terminal domain-containing protein n=1 Tax=viral metagenome TaxID=1070528 RepID=A0A6C0KTR1_9ZZZZ
MGLCISSVDISTFDSTFDSTVHHDEDLAEEFHENVNKNIPYVFNDILDDKHAKYMDRYNDSNRSLYWGLGIENETYFMLDSLQNSSQFKSLKQKRERYSVDYYKNFKEGSLQKIFDIIKTYDQLTYPIYVNAHTFKNTDIHLEHKTHYDKDNTPNQKFIESIHDILMRESRYYNDTYDKSFVFDGDSIEFITQNFYNATVDQCFHEFVEHKETFIREISPFFEEWNIGSLQFPDHNYGMVSFLSTQKKQLSLCNNGTYHINITLPTVLVNGIIDDRDRFAKEHLQLIRFIQIVEPLMVACYGTPDVFSIIDNAYCIGSLRVGLSRYISLQTFDTDAPVNGKLLLMSKPEDPDFWMNQMFNSPYYMNKAIGYDINFNKFKNHGIEIRFFDWFPETYLKDVMNFFVLLAQHSFILTNTFHKSSYHTIIKNCVQKGHTCNLTKEECNIILTDLGLAHVYQPHTPHALLCYMNDILFDLYHDSPVVRLLSPHMSRPQLVNYNQLAFQALYHDLFGKPLLVIRSEENPTEARVPIVPSDLPFLSKHFRIMVESSSVRCYPDESYFEKGATIVPKGYWSSMRYSYVIGLKEITTQAHSSQTLLHFAHCFKGQDGWQNTLSLLKDCRFIDYEYMLDQEKKRVISFCGQSGKIGTYLALMTFYMKSSIIPSFDEEYYYTQIQKFIYYEKKPRVLLIGYGTVGKHAKKVLDAFDIPCTVWTSRSIAQKKIIMEHDILIHAIRLPDDSSISPPPFLVKDDLSNMGSLSIICDISCDVGNPRNTLPIYDTYTSRDHPVCSLTDSIRLIAINHLPSLEPTVSSNEFSSILHKYLINVPYYRYTKDVCPLSAALYGSEQKFRQMIQ